MPLPPSPGPDDFTCSISFLSVHLPALLPAFPKPPPPPLESVMSSNGNHLPFCKMFTNGLSLELSSQSTVSEKHTSDHAFPLFGTFRRLPIVLSVQAAVHSPSQDPVHPLPSAWAYFPYSTSVTSAHREALLERPHQGWLPVTDKHSYLSFTAHIRCKSSNDISMVCVSTCLLCSTLN